MNSATIDLKFITNVRLIPVAKIPMFIPFRRKLSFAENNYIPYTYGMQRANQQLAPLLGRVKKITGQVQGVGRMIESNRECPEILHTISSIHSALRSLEALLLADHVRHCVSDAAADPDQLERRLEEIITLYKRRLA